MASASAAARSGVAVRHFEVARETASRWLSSVLWDCFGDKFAALLKRRPQKQSHNALAPGLTRNLKVANIQHFRQASWSSHSAFMHFCYRTVHEAACALLMQKGQFYQFPRKGVAFEHALLHGVECSEV